MENNNNKAIDNVSAEMQSINDAFERWNASNSIEKERSDALNFIHTISGLGLSSENNERKLRIIYAVVTSSKLRLDFQPSEKLQTKERMSPVINTFTDSFFEKYEPKVAKSSEEKEIIDFTGVVQNPLDKVAMNSYCQEIGIKLPETSYTMVGESNLAEFTATVVWNGQLCVAKGRSKQIADQKIWSGIKQKYHIKG